MNHNYTLRPFHRLNLNRHNKKYYDVDLDLCLPIKLNTITGSTNTPHSMYNVQGVVQVYTISWKYLMYQIRLLEDNTGYSFYWVNRKNLILPSNRSNRRIYTCKNV